MTLLDELEGIRHTYDPDRHPRGHGWDRQFMRDLMQAVVTQHFGTHQTHGLNQHDAFLEVLIRREGGE